MKLARKGITFVAGVLLSIVPLSGTFADAIEPVVGFAGQQIVTPVGAGKAQANPRPAVTAIMYDNTASAANTGISSTDLLATFGDRVLPVGFGVLSSQTVTLFNSGSSAGPIFTATIVVQIFDGITNVLIGAYSANVDFATGLNPGFYSLITVTTLDPFAINLNVPDLIVTQTVTQFTGTATRFGIASLTPPTVGSSPPSMYCQAVTIGGGIPGFYNFGVPTDPGYQLLVTVPTVGNEASTWSVLKGLYR
jgi:hypothetical protein